MCGKTCLKSTNLVFIAILLLTALVEILFGAYMLVYMYKINRPEALGQYYIAIPSLFLILFGIILLHLVLLGSCGICKEVACCVNMYSLVLLVLAVLQILMGVFAIITFLETNSDLTDQITEDFGFSFGNYQRDPKLINTIQNEMQCCGISSPKDWLRGAFKSAGAGELPSSCCGDRAYPCHVNSNFLFENGCGNVISDYVLYWNSIIGYVSVIIGAQQFLVAALGFSLGCGSFRDYYKV